MSTQISVSVRIDLVEDMSTDANRATRPKTLGIPFIFLYFYRIIFLCLSPEIPRFAYYGIMREDCEGKLYSSTLGESIVSPSRLI